MTNQNSPHPARQRIQDFLDGQLSPGERTAFRKHLDTCTRCRTDVREWRELFSRLEEVERLDPGPAFADRVMDAVERPDPLPSRIVGWIRGFLPDPNPESRHLRPDTILDYLDGAAPASAVRRVEAHVEACAACHREVSEWQDVFHGLESLDRVSPPAGFTGAVMARVDARERPVATREPDLVDRALGWLEPLRPRGPRGWAAASAVAATPVIALVSGVLALFSHPLLTPSNLAAFLWWQVSDTAGAFATGALQGLAQSPLLLEIRETLQLLADAPLLVGAGAVMFSALTLAALWILHRNLTSGPSVDRYANVSA